MAVAVRKMRSCGLCFVEGEGDMKDDVKSTPSGPCTVGSKPPCLHTAA